MNDSPFREAAFESRIKGFSNPVSIQGSLSVGAMLIGIAAVTAALLLYAYFTDYTRKASVMGYLSPAAGTISITAPITGNLEFDIENGAFVSKGDLIATVQSLNLDTTGRSLHQTEIESAQKSITLAKQRLALANQQLNSLGEQKDASFSDFDRTSKNLSTLLQSRQSEYDLMNAERAREQRLFDQNAGSAMQLSAAKQAALNAERAARETQDAINARPLQLEQLRLDWSGKELEYAQALANIECELAALEAQMSDSEIRNNAGIFAPVDREITYTQAQQGQIVNQGSPLFLISPKDSELRANLLAPSSAIGFAKVGERAQIRYQSFPFREHGVFEGTIADIDQTAQLPSAINAPINASEPVYRVVLTVEQQPKDKKGEVLTLSPGMVLEGSIIIDKNPLLFWFFDPVT